MLAGVVALLGVLFIGFFPHWYEVVVFSIPAPQIAVNALGPLVFFLIIALVAGVNPILRAWAPRLSFGSRELFWIVSVWLLAGVISYTQLTTPALSVAGNTFNPVSGQTMSKRVEFHSLLNSNLFLPADAAKDYYYGTGNGLHRLSFADVPWREWRQPLLFWIPLLLCVVALSLSLVRIVHRQWSKHELLSFPIADVTQSLLNLEPGRAFPALCYNKIFWGGFGLIGFICLVNGLNLWFPKMIVVPLDWAYFDLIKQFPFLNDYCGREAYSLFRGMAYPFIVALAVLLPAEISLTCWLGWVLMVFGTGFYFLSTGETIGATETSQIQAGMYVAMLVTIAFIGRREYLAVGRHAFRLRLPEEPQLRRSVVACRVFIVSFAALTGLLMVAGLPWPVALVAVACFTLVLLLAARMTAEIGLPWLPHLSGLMQGLPVKILGAAALGPQALAMLTVLGVAVGSDMTNSIVAQATTCAKLDDNQSKRRRELGLRLWLGIGIGVALLATVVATLSNNYSFGARREEKIVANLRSSVEQTSSQINQLRAEGITGNSADLARVKSEPKFWRFFLYGAVIVGGCALLRLRFTWWPFHPLPLLLFGSWTLSRLYFSFLIGWLIKLALVKIAGGKVFAASKPFFIGIIVGQIFMATLWMFVGAIYYLATGTQPPAVNLFM
ncbi:MAG: hypothetical protein PCFJNLEI_00575 [Verrucomicrobiae bacterium]|nr:hypothetical protein [Verrucomicrobiae bacterium]